MKKVIRILAQAGAILSLAACGTGDPPPPTAAATPTPCVGPAITLGDIGDRPAEIIESMQPLASYLAARLAPSGIACGTVKVASTVDAIAELIKNGEVDIYFDSVYPAYLISEATGAQPILRQWRTCDPEYYSVIVARADSDISSIDDLPGHMIAMDQRYSTSGFVLPSAYLLDQGFALAIKNSVEEQVASNEVGILFTGDDNNSLAHMLAGKVDVAATDDFRYAEWEKTAPGRFILLGQTEPMPRRAALVGANIEPELRQAIKDELIAAESNPDGKAAMAEMAGTCRFDDTPEGIEAAFIRMSQMDQMIQAISGLTVVIQP